MATIISDKRASSKIAAQQPGIAVPAATTLNGSTVPPAAASAPAAPPAAPPATPPAAPSNNELLTQLLARFDGFDQRLRALEPAAPPAAAATAAAAAAPAAATAPAAAAAPQLTDAQRATLVAAENAALKAQLRARDAEQQARAATAATAATAPQPAPANAAPNSTPPNPAQAKRILVNALREAKHAQAALAAAQIAAGVPVTPALADDPEQPGFLEHLGDASPRRMVLAFLIPTLLALAASSAMANLASWAIAAVATLSPLALWPFLIVVLTVLLAGWLALKLFSTVGTYILSQQIDEDIATVWGYLSSPFRTIDVTKAVNQVGVKIDHLQQTVAGTP